MLIDVHDDADNWEKWGKLVQSWAHDPKLRPADATAMQQQIWSAGIDAGIPGANDQPPRPVVFYQYYDYPDPNGNTVPLILPLPSSKMLQDAQGALGVPQPYPLSRFYAIAFGGVSEGALIPAELLKFELRRLGEYVILQCQ